MKIYIYEIEFYSLKKIHLFIFNNIYKNLVFILPF
jgi:hypothetical protein